MPFIEGFDEKLIERLQNTPVPLGELIQEIRKQEAAIMFFASFSKGFASSARRNAPLMPMLEQACRTCQAAGIENATHKDEVEALIAMIQEPSLQDTERAEALRILTDLWIDVKTHEFVFGLPPDELKKQIALEDTALAALDKEEPGDPRKTDDEVLELVKERDDYYREVGIDLEPKDPDVSYFYAPLIQIRARAALFQLLEEKLGNEMAS